jgi:hypothetical protein
MATKVQQKSDKITPFGGINFVMDKFDAYLGDEIDSFMGLRSTTVGYQYSVSLPLMCLFGVEATDRVKSFLFRFIAVPAKWIRTARQNVLNVYSGKPYDLIWAYG